MPISGLTLLDAVNQMLSSVSQSPVSSLQAPLTATVGIAISILNEVKREVLMDGYLFNSDDELPMKPDPITKQITIPDNILRVDGSKYKNGSKNLTERSGLLYDRKGRTFLFTQDVIVDVIYNLEFDDLPEVAKNYVAKRAARVLVDRTFSDGTASRIFQIAEREAFIRLNKHEKDVGDYNLLTGSFVVNKISNRRSGFTG